MESENDRARGLREQHIALADLTDAAQHDIDPHLSSTELRQCIGECFGWTTLICLDDDAELRDRAFLERARDILERATACRATILCFALEALALLRDLACFVGVGDDEERVASRWYAIEAEHLDRHRRTDGLDRLAAFVEKAGVPHDRVLTDAELDATIREHGDTVETFYLGHDYAAASLLRFFAAADRQGI